MLTVIVILALFFGAFRFLHWLFLARAIARGPRALMLNRLRSHAYRAGRRRQNRRRTSRRRP